MKIFNISLETGKHPDILKISKTIPIFKKGSRLAVNNYRPISLLSNLNKILEKLVHDRTYKFLENLQCIYSLQFGFRKKHSTNHALIDITETIRQALDNKKIVCGIFVDLQKPFDTVNHDILIDKLDHYGVRGTANDWFSSYLKNRSQFVSILGFESATKPVNHGVPQGSVLGPLLFLIYINDLHSAVKSSKVYHFADDTNLLNIGSSPKKMQKSINADLKIIYKWLLANKISLNSDKTEIIEIIYFFINLARKHLT
jgi:retron-type reverse transcriptase